MMTLLACWRRLQMPQWLGGPTSRTALRLVLFVLASAVYWLFLIASAIALGLRATYNYATHVKLRCHDHALSARALGQATLAMLYRLDTVVLGIYDPSVPTDLICPSSADDIVEMTPFAAYIVLWKGIVGLLCFQLPLSLWLVAIKFVKRFFDRDYYAYKFYPECSFETRPFVLLHACAYIGFGLLLGHALSSLLLQSALYWNRVVYPTPSYTPIDEKSTLLSTSMTSADSKRPLPYEIPAATRTEDHGSRLDGYLELWQAVLESNRVFVGGHTTLLACLEDTTRLACSTLRATPAQWTTFHALAQRQLQLRPTPTAVAREEVLDDDDSVVDTSPIALEKPTPVLFTRATHTETDRDYDMFYTDNDTASTTTTNVYRDIPDPTEWVSPTAYSSTRVLTYDEPERREPVAVSRALVSRSVHQAAQPTTRTDRVHFTAYAPVCVSPASTFSHAIYAFLVHQRDEMREEAMADGVAKQLSRDLLLHVRRGAFVTISLQLPDGFRHAGDASQLLSWRGDVTHVAFEIECCDFCAEGQVLLEATIVVGTSVLVLRSYLFVSALRQDTHVQELVSELEVVPETFHEIAYGDLELKEVVGRGHFGDAHRATYLGQDVVVKTLRPSEFGDNADQIVAAFRHEAAVLSLFGRHPNIVPFVGACTDLSQPLSLVTEYLPFGSLEDQLSARRSPLSTEQKTRILCDAASGFLNIHEGGFIHRDIAARNCLVDDQLRARVCDFGLCRRVHSYGGGHFAEGAMPLKYLAPESLTPPHSFSYRSDSYSFGVLIWETFTESKPFPTMTSAEAAAYVLEGHRLELGETIPTRYQSLIARCLQDDPAKRPSMATIVQELTHAMTRN